MNDSDLSQITQTCGGLYAALSFNDQRPPNWDQLRRLFVDKGHLVRLRANGAEHFEIEDFIAWVERARRDGLKSFVEVETDSSTHLMGGLAHRASHYKATVGGPSGGTIEGINSIQLVRCEDEWRVLSLAWEIPDGA